MSARTDGYYDGIPEGYYVVETAFGEELRPINPPLRPINPPLHTWDEDRGDGVTVGRSAGGGCATCDGGGCGECQ